MTALVTPFKNGQLDLDALKSLVEWQIESGTKALVPVGTTGESPTLTHDEHDLVVEVVVNAAAGRGPVIAGAGFVARSFAGDAKQVRTLLKAALSHRGTAVLDIISPCVAFNNEDDSPQSYAYGREHERELQEIGYVPQAEEIVIEDYDPGELRVVEMHDGSRIHLRKIEEDYDAGDKIAALQRLQRAQDANEFITGMIYLDTSRPSLSETQGLGQVPIAALPDDRLRPSESALTEFLKTYA